MEIKAFDRPLEVTTVDGEVVITGPDGLNASLTVEAARVSAERLLESVRDLDGDGPRETYQKPLG